MSLESIYPYLGEIGGWVIVLMTLVQLTPLKINPWSWIARQIGNAFNKSLIERLDVMETRQKDIENKIDLHIKESEAKEALCARRNILLFGREIICGQLHTREEYQECLSYIDNYEKYCKLNPDFPNNRALFAIQLVKDSYKERLDKADFLEESYRGQK